MKHLKLTVLNDNDPAFNLENEWGWSVFLESEKWKILFDADTNPHIIEYNAKALNINLKELDFAILSHYHEDHYGGFEHVGNVAKGLRIYVPQGESGFLKNWGLNPVEGCAGKIAKDVWLSGALGVFIKEQAVGIKVDNIGLVIIVGCSHPGVDVITTKLKEITNEKIFLVIGGFHSPPKNVLDNLASLSEYVSPAHCSGIQAKNYVKAKYPNKYIAVKTGSIVDIS